MEPFGQDMPEPLAEISGQLSEVRKIGADGATLRMKIMDHGEVLAQLDFAGALWRSSIRPEWRFQLQVIWI